MFSRQLILSDNLDTEQIAAHYAGGVLTVRLPVAERAKPRKIIVNSNRDDPQPIDSDHQGRQAVSG